MSDENCVRCGQSFGPDHTPIRCLAAQLAAAKADREDWLNTASELAGMLYADELMDADDLSYAEPYDFVVKARKLFAGREAEVAELRRRAEIAEGFGQALVSAGVGMKRRAEVAERALVIMRQDEDCLAFTDGLECPEPRHDHEHCCSECRVMWALEKAEAEYDAEAGGGGLIETNRVS